MILANHFIDQYAKENKQPNPKEWNEEATKIKNSQSIISPEMSRELKPWIDLAAVLCDRQTSLRRTILPMLPVKRGIKAFLAEE